jgi:hypothetical protein
MEHKKNDKIYVCICRSITKDICVYINDYRVYGGHPSDDYNILKDFYVDRKDLEKALNLK